MILRLSLGLLLYDVFDLPHGYVLHPFLMPHPIRVTFAEQYSSQGLSLITPLQTIAYTTSLMIPCNLRTLWALCSGASKPR